MTDILEDPQPTLEQFAAVMPNLASVVAEQQIATRYAAKHREENALLVRQCAEWLVHDRSAQGSSVMGCPRCRRHAFPNADLSPRHDSGISAHYYVAREVLRRSLVAS